jgi:uncharacterized protein YqjF (DUF2071 family)
MKFTFLKAEWRKLAIANYSIDPEILKKYVPTNTELDLWGGKCYVSLVGFMFLNTKILGIKVPLHINFEEVNLRFYVKHLENGVWKRGVVFIKELVPKSALTFVANSLYKEHYQTVPMNHTWIENEKELEVNYNWEMNKSNQSFIVKAENNLLEIPEESEAEFITEHYWGYSKISDNKTVEYEVTHPRWKMYPAKEFQIDVDFQINYGSDFECMNQQKPISVFLIEGSEITVKNKKTIYKNKV